MTPQPTPRCWPEPTSVPAERSISFVKLEGSDPADILQRVLISGDFFVTPPRVVFDLEAALQGTRLDELEPAIEQFFAETEIDTLSVTPADFKASIEDALGQEAAHG